MSADSSTPVRLSGRYVLGEPLAVGGMGEVHVATDERLARRVAVKLLHRAHGGSAEAVERFRREAVVVAGLIHPSIAQVYDYGVHDDGIDEPSHFIVMELAPGTDLADLLRRRGRLDPHEAVSIATQVCAALTAAHRAGVVHRDIKPGNVIVSPELRVKVTDFGIARSLGHSALTDVGTILGTAAYLPPEQARGEAATPASDLYSLGILLYQMLTGRPPFEGDTPVAVALRHLDEPVPAPSASAPGVPAGLDRVVAVATAKDPADRYADAAAMAAALRDALPDDPAAKAQAAQAAQAAHSGQPARPAAAGTDATALVALPLDATRAMPALPPAVPAAPRTALTARTARHTASSAARSGRRVAWAAAAVAALVLVVGGGMLLADRPEAPRVASGPSVAPGPATTTTGSPTPTRVPTSKAEAPTPEQPTSTPPADEVRLPDGLVGTRSADARRTLEVMGLKVQTVQARSRADRGQVLATVPGAGATVPAGQTVVLVVSRGGVKSESRSDGGPSRGDTLTVPGWIVGSSAADVRDALPDNLRTDLRVTTVSVPSAQPKGTVVATWPAVGEPLTDGQLVLVVASGRGD
ncbi:protein kinase domain-containing protein [Humibacillus xanthopallidus]|uniref:non-specific serine/threonine protein kinase n=1 Tax=Humibacillus xanthopallidus TaxID=412689 RepID=A0A543I066_9MICO|nr:protein kinase [Humibacillus xanthopallidus]TQM63930.1 serine/threonine-protein kinase [Humibacillus xanthopallidus]